MELDVSLDKSSFSIHIDNPFRLDADAIAREIEEFIVSKDDSVAGLDIKGLLPRMVKGIAGCEKGCPADAKGLVSRGHDDFEIAYIEGGILSARAVTGKGNVLYLKMFPEF